MTTNTPTPPRSGLRPRSPLFVVLSVLACGAMYGAGFGIGNAVGSDSGSGTTTSSTSTTRLDDPLAVVSGLEDGLALLQSARNTLDDEVIPIIPSATDSGTSDAASPCTDPTDVVTSINDAIDQRRQATDDIAAPLAKAHPESAALISQFTRMVDLLNKADQYRISFVNADYTTWQKSGCKGDPPITDSESFDDFGNANDDADKAVQDFLDTFNPKAKAVRLQSSWTVDDV